MPCALCTVRAQASFRGTCTRVRLALTVPCSNRSKPRQTDWPPSKRTTGRRSRKASTTPRLPFTSPRRGWFFTRTTCAPGLSFSSAGTFFSRMAAYASLLCALPTLERLFARKTTILPGSRASCASFSLSTFLLVQYSFVGMMPSSGTGFTSTEQAASSASARGVTTPQRTSLRTSAKTGSPDCRTVSCRTTVPPSRPHSSHEGVWKQKRLGFSPRPCTGGSCRKSPQKRTCRPPKGSGEPRTFRAMAFRLSKSSASSMDTSSTTSTRVVFQRFAALPFSTFRRSLGSGKSPRPTPAKLWIVWPPMFAAAMPVGAVTATSPGKSRSSSCTR
mmetsp:Transcript_97367/g.302725  ORF Transcript_97367/g.302725 Transcript_97367/m.302725 type:complete len:331 (-) Transcript_97367:414-1406(-)